MLRPGTILQNKYLIGRALGQGGFAITYLGLQTGLGRRVAIKEYLPRNLAERCGQNGEVTPKRNIGPVVDVRKAFERGLEGFLEEGRLIVQCHQPAPHPNLVRVTDYFRANGTAYLVMDFAEGISLEDHLNRHPGHCVDEKHAIRLMMPILEGLRAVHRHGFYHRDIKPANIILTAQDTAVLIDFGSARYKALRAPSSANTPLTPGYAPPEQYSGTGVQGSWTDVYGCAATLYRCITGIVPASATDRLLGVPLTPPSEVPGCSISRGVESVVLWGLEMEREKRPQTADAFQKALARPKTAPARFAIRRNSPSVFPKTRTPASALKSVFFLSAISIVLILAGYGIVAEIHRRTALDHSDTANRAEEMRRTLETPLLETFAPAEFNEAERLFATAERLRESDPRLSAHRYEESFLLYRQANEIARETLETLKAQSAAMEAAESDAKKQRDNAVAGKAADYAKEDWEEAEVFMESARARKLTAAVMPPGDSLEALEEAERQYRKTEARFATAYEKAQASISTTVNTLLTEADSLYESDKLTGWFQDNAYYKYSSVLKIDPGNVRATQGIQNIIERYKTKIENALNSGRRDDARNLYQETERIEGVDKSTLNSLRETTVFQ